MLREVVGVEMSAYVRKEEMAEDLEASLDRVVEMSCPRSEDQFLTVYVAHGKVSWRLLQAVS